MRAAWWRGEGREGERTREEEGGKECIWRTSGQELVESIRSAPPAPAHICIYRFRVCKDKKNSRRFIFSACGYLKTMNQISHMTANYSRKESLSDNSCFACLPIFKLDMFALGDADATEFLSDRGIAGQTL